MKKALSGQSKNAWEAFEQFKKISNFHLQPFQLLLCPLDMSFLNDLIEAWDGIP